MFVPSAVEWYWGLRSFLDEKLSQQKFIFSAGQSKLPRTWKVNREMFSKLKHYSESVSKYSTMLLQVNQKR